MNPEHGAKVQPEDEAEEVWRKKVRHIIGSQVILPRNTNPYVGNIAKKVTKPVKQIPDPKREPVENNKRVDSQIQSSEEAKERTEGVDGSQIWDGKSFIIN